MSLALEQTNAARKGVICQGASSKLPLLACMVTLFLCGTSKVLLLVSRRRCSQHARLHWLYQVTGCLGKNQKMPFSLFSMATSLVLFVFGHGVETSHLGDVSAQELCQASEDFSLELPPARMKVTHLMST